MCSRGVDECAHREHTLRQHFSWLLKHLHALCRHFHPSVSPVSYQDRDPRRPGQDRAETWRIGEMNHVVKYWPLRCKRGSMCLLCVQTAVYTIVTKLQIWWHGGGPHQRSLHTHPFLVPMSLMSVNSQELHVPEGSCYCGL